MRKTLVFLGFCPSPEKDSKNLELENLTPRQKIIVFSVSLLVSVVVFCISHLLVSGLGPNFKFVPISLALFSLILLLRRGGKIFSKHERNPKNEE